MSHENVHPLGSGQAYTIREVTQPLTKDEIRAALRAAAEAEAANKAAAEAAVTTPKPAKPAPPASA